MPQVGDFAARAMRSWSEFVPELDPRAAAMAIRFQRTARLLTKAQTRGLRRFGADGITGIEDFRTMALLRRSEPPGLQVSDIAEMLRITRGATSNRMERLVNQGHAVRTDNPHDRRSHFISLTPGGAELTDEMYREIARAHQKFFAPLSSDQSEHLAEALWVLLSAYEPEEIQTTP